MYAGGTMRKLTLVVMLILLLTVLSVGLIGDKKDVERVKERYEDELIARGSSENHI